MDVIVDGERNFNVQGTPKDVLAIVVAASELLHERRRAILALNVDGDVISPDCLVDELENKPLDNVQAIEITSEDVITLATTSLGELQEVLPELPKACHDLAEVFQGGDPEAGYKPFDRLAEVWRHVKVREAQAAHALDVDLDGIEVGGVSIKDIHTELNGFLAEAAEALEQGDCVLLGDLLEYELAPRAETEAGIVALLQARAVGEAG